MNMKQQSNNVGASSIRVTDAAGELRIVPAEGGFCRISPIPNSGKFY